MLGLSNNVLKSWEELEIETGSLEKRPSNRKPLKVNLDKLQKYCEENPLATHVEAGVHFGYPERIIRYAKKLLGITRKKTAQYKERDEEERVNFTEEINKLPNDIEIFYIDESGFEEYYTRLYGYSKKGQRVH